MNRRTFLATSAMALVGTTAARGATAAVPSLITPGRTPRRLPALAPVRMSWDRVLRTTVGLRPHRDSGFVLKAEQFDHKTIIHNYGHGGAGMSLAWGTGALAADLAVDHPSRTAAVIGCGSPGLTAARQLQRRGFDVTIYASTVPPHTTSNMSMAAFTPTAGLVEDGKRTAAWDDQFRRAADISYRQLQLMAGTSNGYGVYWIDSYVATDDPTRRQRASENRASALLPEPLRSGRDREILKPGEHPFPTRFAIRTSTLSIEPSAYLEALIKEFRLFGGRIVIRRFDSPADLVRLTEPIIVNCTGLGSLALFDDRELVPIKGQLSVLAPQPEVTYRVTGAVAGYDGTQVSISMNPRSDGLTIGNLQARGAWSLEPDTTVRDQNVNAAIAFFGAMATGQSRGGTRSASPTAGI